jgi:hypothetical protein
MLLTSTPGAPLGMAHNLFKRDYKPDGSPRRLVAHGGTLDFNPSVEQAVIDQAYEDDPEAAEAEVGGKFRTPMSAYLPRAVLDRAVNHNIVPIRRRFPNIIYRMYVDTAAGSGRDSFAYCVGHVMREEGRNIIIIDELQERQPPFNLDDTIRDVCEAAKFWGTNVMGDQYGRPLISTFARHGVQYTVNPYSTSEVYLHSRLAWDANCVVLPVFERVTEKAVEQFLRLRRKVHPGGRESVEHLGSKSHDDIAVAISGLIHLCTPTHAGAAELLSSSSYGFGVYHGAPGGPISGPDGSDTRTPQFGDPYVATDEADRRRLERAKERREEARKTGGSSPPKKYRGLLW